MTWRPAYGMFVHALGNRTRAVAAREPALSMHTMDGATPGRRYPRTPSAYPYSSASWSTGVPVM